MASEGSGQSQPLKLLRLFSQELQALLSGQQSGSSSSQLSGVDVGFLLESIKLISGQPTVLRLGDSGRARFESVLPAIRKVARETDIPWPLLAGLAWTESSFNPIAKGPQVGGFCGQAMGLFQICRGWFPLLRSQGIWANPDSDWKIPEKSARAAAFILRRHGLGQADIEQVIKAWGGFVTVDHRPFRDKVLNRSTFLAIDSLIPRGLT